MEILCSNPSIPESFFEKHLDKVDWHCLCRNPGIPEEFFEKHLDKLSHDNWNSLSENKSLSLKFVLKHENQLNWVELCVNDNIPKKYWDKRPKDIYLGIVHHRRDVMDFLEKESGESLERVDWPKLIANKSVPISFLEKNVPRMYYESVVFGSPNITEEFIFRYLWTTKKSVLCLCKQRIASNESLSEEFFERNFEFFSSEMLQLCENRNISFDFYEKHLDKVDWDKLSEHPGITFEFIEKHQAKINWKHLSGNLFDFDEKYIEIKKRRYSETLKRELSLEREENLRRVQKAIYGLVLHELSMRIRDLNNKVISSMI